MAYTEFYVTKGSAASDNNGGGPSLGTNDGPVATASNCSSSADGLTITDDDSGTWAGASVDDWVCFDPAGTADYTRITAISGSDLTVTPAVALSASAKTCNVGGAWTTINHATGLLSTSFVNASGDTPRLNLKYDAVAYTEDVTTTNDFTAAIPLVFEGYYATPGDKCDNSGTRNMPLVESSAADTILLSKLFWILRYIHAKSTGTSKSAIYILGTGDRCRVEHCKADGSSGSATRGLSSAGQYSVIVDCECSNSGASTNVAIGLNGDRSVAIGCIVNNANLGISVGTYGIQVINCIVNGGVTGISASYMTVVTDNTFYNQSGAAISLTAASTYGGCVRNNICASYGTYGIEADASASPHEDYNAFWPDGGTAETNNVLFRGDNDVTLTADPFTDAANGDFSLNNNAGGGAACRAAGFPGEMFDGASTGYLDVGALQHQDSGGTSSMKRIVGMAGSM